MAFPTLFPDGKGDPTNQGLLRDVSFQERIKHLLKFAEIIDGKWGIPFCQPFPIFILGIQHDSEKAKLTTNWNFPKTEPR